MANQPPAATLDDQLEVFRRGRFLAMPIAGALVWSAIGVAGAALPTIGAVWSIFIGTGVIFYVGLGVAKLTGEDLLGRERKGNLFDRLFLLATFQAVLVYAIAIPFFLVEPTSLPMSVGVLTGLMWVTFSGMLGHWVGLFHTLLRTTGVLATWYLLPDARFVAVPLAVVAAYVVTIAILVRRPWDPRHA